MADFHDDDQYKHPLADRLRERADHLRLRGVHGPEVRLMERAADAIEELHRQNVVLRQTCGMEPLPPVE